MAGKTSQLSHPSLNKLFRTATSHGHCGYILRGDSDELALWLFFFSNMDEMNQILNTITQ
ncbi:MAG: hypothetical protein IJK84_04660 [Bacteroidales bacterium]|nr:hypothetical protein [Bacteroidales bacterium]